MNNVFKTPAALTALIANFLMAVGALIGWFSLSSSLQSVDSLAGNIISKNLNAKKITTIVVAILAILLTIFVLRTGKRLLQIIPLALDAFLVWVTCKQLSGQKLAESLGVHYQIGYWLSLVMSIIASAGCLWIILALKNESRSAAMPGAMPTEPYPQTPTALPQQPVAPQPQVMPQPGAVPPAPVVQPPQPPADPTHPGSQLQ